MITMSQKEAARLLVLEQVRQGALSQSAAAAVLQLSTCQLRRIERRYQAAGPPALVHGLRGRASNHTLDAALAPCVRLVVASDLERLDEFDDLQHGLQRGGDPQDPAARHAHGG
ncbi:helix-turn-helix domain-containing protein [Castellaniella sp. WN]